MARISATSIADSADPVLREGEATMSVEDATQVLGIPVAGTIALVEAGILGRTATPLHIPVREIEDFVEQLRRSAIAVASDAPGAGLVAAVEAVCQDPSIWPTVIAALLNGRINPFRRRGGGPGPLLASFVLSSEHLVSDLVTSDSKDGETPFIWMPAAPH